MPRWLVTALNLTVASAAGAVLVAAVLGPVASVSQAGSNPLLAATVVTHPGPTTAQQSPTTVEQSPTTAHHTSTTHRTTRPTPATAPPTVKATTTLPVKVAPTVPSPTTVAPTPRHYVPRRAPVATAPTTSTSSTTATTIAPIGGHIPVPPSTLPLRTKVPSTHVSPIFAWLSGAGFFVALVIMATRFVLTRPGRRP
jgi:hypothetical protein